MRYSYLILRIPVSFVMGLLVSFMARALAVPPAEAFGELPNLYDAAISPDGEEVASIVNYKGDYVVTLSYLDQSKNTKPRLIGLNKGVKPGAIF